MYEKDDEMLKKESEFRERDFYKLKYTLKKFSFNDERGIYGDGNIILESDSLNGFLEEILKDAKSVYVLLYPCTKGSPNFDFFTGRWSLKIGLFEKEINERNKNSAVVGSVTELFHILKDVNEVL